MSIRRLLTLPFVALVLAIALTTLLAPTPAYANSTITVHPGEVEIADNGRCSLREAIINANDDAATHPDCPAGTGDDTIIIPAGTYTLNDATAPVEDFSVTGDLDLRSNITLQGAGASTTILDGNQTDRVLHVVSGVAVVNDLTIRNGRSPAGADAPTGCTFGDCRSFGEDGRNGGGIANGGILTLNRVLVTDNETGAGGAGGDLSCSLPEDECRARGGNGGGGAGIVSFGPSLTIHNSVIQHNRTGNGGAAGANTCTGGATCFVLSSQQGDGGGISLRLGNALTMSLSHLSHNSGGFGGGIDCVGTCTITQSIIQNNEASRGGGGLYFNHSSSQVINHTTVANNTSMNSGGGIFVNRGPVTISNVTLSGNDAGYHGGGIASSATTTLNHVTVVNNRADANNSGGGDGGGIYRTGGTLNLRNSVVAGNSYLSGSAPDCGGTITSQFYNHIGSLTGCTFTPGTGDVTGSDPQLGPLADNGGPTLTHALLPGSPAIDTIPTSDASCNPGDSPDQRGASRANGPGAGGSACDAGAYEFDSVPPVCFATHNNGTDIFASADSQAVRDAVAAVSAGGTVKIAGTCAGTVTEGGTDQLVRVTQPITLAGGFTMADWITPSSMQTTTLDALQGGRVVLATAALTVQDLTVQNGYLTAASPAGDGAGIHAEEALNLSGVILYNNATMGADTSGGGAYMSGLGTVVNTTFISNTATYRGGGMRQNVLRGGTISGTTFLNNMANDGGGLSAENSVQIMSTTFLSNTASAFGGGASLLSSARITDTHFIGNRTGDTGGGLDASDDLQITGGSFIDNWADEQGGGISVRGSGSITGSCIVGNSDTAVTGLVSAAGNWWGSISGPSGNGPGIGDSVDSQVTFAPFLTAAILGCPTVDADLAIVKMASPQSASPGDVITYTLTFTNTGPSTATGVVLNDSVPVSVTVTGVTSSTVGSGVVITQTSGAPNFAWDVSDLPVGAGGVITLTGTVSPSLSAAGLFTNTATITASNDITVTNNSSVAGVNVTCLNTIIVQNSDDSGPGSLRQAIEDICPGGVIDFDTTLAGQTITLTTGTLNIGTSVTISASVPISVSGNNSSTVIDISFSEVTLAGLTIRDGSNSDLGGGGITNITAGKLTLIDTTVTSNTATLSGGGIYMSGDTSLTLIASQVISNTSGKHGAGIYNADGTITVTDGSLVAWNRAVEGGGGILNGGGIRSNVSITGISITGSCIVGNSDTAVTGSVSATGNWWGHPSGPSAAGPGIGDSIGNNVDASGFLTTPILGCDTLGDPDLGIVKTVEPETAQPGAAITYTLSFSNTGERFAHSVTISDSVPVSVTISGVVSSTTGGVDISQSSGAPNFAWDVSDLPVGAGGVITLTGTVNRNAALFGTAFTNTATITASNDITAANNRADASLTVDALNCPAAGTTTLYVTANGAGAMTGAGWDNALASLQDALLFVDACPGLAVSEIWVAAGVYYPDQGLLQINDDRSSTFQLKNGVALYGGFTGTENTLAERDWETNVTILSGDLDGNDISDGGVVTDTANITGANAYHVVTGSGTDDTALLDGFTVTAGLADGDTSPANYGGGMLNQNGSPTLINVSFWGNEAFGGGGMSNDSASPTLTNVSFSGNSAVIGGSMSNDNNSRPTLTNVSFSDNNAAIGGGMYNLDSSLTLTNVTFSGNHAISDGGGMANTNSSLTLINVIFSGNRANFGGGMISSSSSLTLTNASLSGNNANQGGGMYNAGSNPTIQNSLFWNNRDNSGEGTARAAIFNSSSTPVIRYSLVQGCNPGGTWDDSCGSDGGDNLNDADPLFVSPPVPADAPTTAGDLRLQVGSPAIDAGNNAYVSGVTTDLDDNARIVNDVVDLGAYESSFATLTPVCFTSLDGLTTFAASADSQAVRDAVAAASAGGTVRIAGYCAGTVTEGGTDQLVRVTQPITLAGGFTMADWITPSSMQTTTLDALQSGRVISATADLTVQDLTIQNGRTTAIGAAGHGAGINSSQALTLSQVILSNNATTGGSTSGGGAFVSGAAGITGTSFVSNTASFNGGGVYVQSTASITGTSFLSNTARSGGGIYALGASALAETNFTGNQASNGTGGGAHVDDATWIADSFFVGNEANGSGGGLWTNQGMAVVTGTLFLSNTAVRGGGAYLADDAIVTNSTFLSNTATTSVGGGAATYGDVSVSGSLFSGNWAEDEGGGAYMQGPAHLTATEFISNTSLTDYGGGAYLHATGALTATTFISNTAGSRGGGLYALGAVSLHQSTFTANSTATLGGGLYANNTAGIMATTFTNNQSVNVNPNLTNGGGAYVANAATILESTFSGNVTSNRGGGAILYDPSTLIATTFVSNTARYGGGLMLHDTSSITGATFLSNTASEGGGGLATYRAAAITNTTFLSNTSTDLGGAIWILNTEGHPVSLVNSLMADNRSLTNRGDAIYLNRASAFEPAGELTLRHNTIANQSSEEGAAIQVISGTVGITNTLIANQAIAIENVDGVVSEDFNLFDNVTTPFSGTVTGGGNSITGNAAFVDAAGGDFQLTAASDAIDAGTDAGLTSDFFGNARPQGGFDIGFHESPFAPAPGDLAIVKTVTPLTAAPGGAITYTLTFNNTGPGTARNVVISDNVPVSVTVTGVTSRTVGGASITQISAAPNFAWTVSDLVPGAGGVITLTGTISESLSAAGWITNTATISATNDVTVTNNSFDAGVSISIPVCFATHDEGTTVYSSADSQSVRDAVAAASAGDTVRIAGYCAGTVNDGGTVQLVRVTQPITVAGGYTTTNWITPSAVQTTTLDALQGGRVILSTAALTVQDLTAQNGYLTAAGEAGHGAGIHAGQTLMLSGVVLYNNATTGSSARAGGVYVSGAVGITATSFISNTAQSTGGGLHAEDAATLMATTFISNTAHGSGGAAFLRESTYIAESTFDSNRSNSWAGGIYVGSTSTLTGTDFFSNTSNGIGGGAYLVGASVITSTHFYSNTAANQGGGAQLEGTGHLTAVRFEGNISNGLGGGLYIADTAWLTATDFIRNTSTSSYGGGLYVRNPVTLTGSTFLSNTATVGGGLLANAEITLVETNLISNTATGGHGGGILVRGAALITQSTFISNTANHYGGGAYLEDNSTLAMTSFSHNSSADRGGGAYISGIATLSELTFTDNTARIGGGLILYSPTSITGTTFLSNTASELGGGLATYRAVAITNTTFLSNTSADLGGAIWISSIEGHPVSLVNSLMADNRSLTNRGDAIYLRRETTFFPAGELILRHNTIANRSVEDGAAIYVLDGTVGITNTLIANQAIAIENVDGVVSEDFNLFDSVTTPISGTVTGGGNSITGNAAFVDAAGGDFQLTAASDAIDAGTDAGITSDFFGNARPQGGFDIGFHESPFAPAPGDLAIVKTVTPLTAAPGEPITYTLTFNNMGPGTARNVAISDSVPVSVTVNGVVSSTVGGATIAQTSAAPNLAWAVSDLAPGAGGAITLTGTVSDSLAVGAIITNTATITAGNDITPINNSSSAGVEITDIPIAGLSAESDSPTVLGHSTAFTATITAGSNVTYTWNFGDGSNPVSGAVTSHVYATAGTFTATVTAANDLGSEEAQTVVSVTNASPIADAGDDQSVEVSEVVTLNASGSSDPDAHLPLTYGWSQTGGPAVTLSDAAGVMPTFTAPDSPATLVFSLVVTDSAGLASTPDTVTVSVGDIAISGLSAQSGSPTVLGDSTAFTATITAGSNVTYTWDFGDGSDPASGPMTSHVYAAAGSYTATVTATNDLGSEAAQTVVSVTNAAPIADAGSDQSVEVNEVVTLNGSGSSDPDGHLPLAYGWAQTGGPAVSLSDASEVMPTFTAPDSPATLVFSLVVTDSAGLASAADTVTVNVGDIAIDGLSAENDSPTVLGQSTAFTATITAGSNVTYTWDFGDGNSGSGAQVSHTYVAAGLYTATVTAENGQGSVSATVETTVLSAPSLTIEKMAEPTVIDEGGTVTYTVVVANVGEIPATGVSVTDDMTGTLADGITLAAGETVTYSYALTADDGPRTTVNTASVSSNQTTPITDSVSVQINNVAPTVSASSVPSVTVGVLLTVTAGFSDPGRIDTHTATVDWGDGNGAAPADVDNFSVSASHVFSAAGVYTVTVCVTDDDGGTGCDALAVTVEDEAITVGNPPAVTNPGDQEATVGVPVTLTLTAEDLDGDALSFSAEGLPPGLSIDAASGVISGTPTSDGEYTVTVSVSDGALSTEVTFVWRVLSAPVEEHSVFLPIIVQFTPVYSNDFATHADGWNLNRLATAPNGQSFLGEFSNETASLTLDNLPTHSQVTVELDLYIIRSWDGNMVEIPDDFIPYRQMRSVDGLFTIGPDKFQVRTGETVLLDTTFANWTQFPQNYPVENSPARTGATAVDTLGYTFQDMPMDTTYRIRLTFDHSDPMLVLDFTGSSLQIIEDESWGIDNVTVWAR